MSDEDDLQYSCFTVIQYSQVTVNSQVIYKSFFSCDSFAYTLHEELDSFQLSDNNN